MQTFEEKVRSMTAKEIILSMVESLIPPPLIRIDMGTFGNVDTVDRKFLGIKFGTKQVCFGCAATNTICKISGVVFNPINISNRETRALAVNTNENFLGNFESAIDALRQGSVRRYNMYAKDNGFATIKDNDGYLPHLYTDYTKKELDPYIELANYQD